MASDAVVKDGISSRQACRPWTPGRGNALLVVLPTAVLALFFLTPLAVVVTRSLSAPPYGTGAYAAVFSNGATLSVVAYTFWTALIVTIGTLLLGYPVAFTVSRMKGSRLAICAALIFIPFWTSTVIRTYAWMVMLQRRGVVNDILLSLGLIDKPLKLLSDGVGMQIAMLHIMLPFMILPLLTAMRGIDPSFVRAAAVLGANPWRQFIDVYLPLTTDGIRAGCILVFISSLGFYITPALLGGQRTMVAVLIEQQSSRLLNWPLASALATVVLAFTCVLFVLYERGVSRSTATGGTR